MNNIFIVDDQDASIKYTGNWSLAGQQADFSQTASSGSPGAIMSFSFSGNLVTAVGDLYAGETCNAMFSIDGVLTNFTSPVTNSNRYQQTLWTTPTLNDGNHTLVYTVASCNNSNSTPWLDYLLYNSSSISGIGGTTFFDDRDSRIAYTGTYNSTSGEDDFRGTITGVGQSSSLLLNFEGTSVQVFGRVDNASVGEITDASFSVDGAASVSFTAVTASNVVHNKQFYASRTLNPGQHSLAVHNTGNIPLWVDYILVRGQSTMGNATSFNSGTGSSHRHEVSVIIGSVVGGVSGILLLIGFAILCKRRSRFEISLTNSPRNVIHQHDESPPSETLVSDSDNDLLHHRPQFIAHHTSSSFSTTGTISKEQGSPARRPLPLPPAQKNFNFSMPSSEAAEFGYHDIDHVELPQLSREGSYSSLPNPYSIRHEHRSYSESSATHSVTASPTMRSTSLAHINTTPLLTDTTSENLSLAGGAGYGFSFVPTRHIQRNAAVDDEGLSDADIKERQGQFFVLSVEGMTASPLVHTDSGFRSHTPQSNADPELQPELPPMYTLE
ncbi:hypothetical protein J3R30DRAFT_3732803 [Lentinula aciculospora]|uniref:Uncharacterized protein n=1 Tax=Lentinula aciculospora TaxID=153920 RepID=A0A9W9AEM2_9AGAR|nr:hypothetical protein J3R30DRAFT_3732803 [Lentinula aciculospora]